MTFIQRILARPSTHICVLSAEEAITAIRALEVAAETFKPDEKMSEHAMRVARMRKLAQAIRMRLGDNTNA